MGRESSRVGMTRTRTWTRERTSSVQFSRWRRLPSDAGKTDAGVAAGAPRHESSAAVLSLAQTAATSVCAAEGRDPRFCYTVRFGTPPPHAHTLPARQVLMALGVGGARAGVRIFG